MKEKIGNGTFIAYIGTEYDNDYIIEKMKKKLDQNVSVIKYKTRGMKAFKIVPRKYMEANIGNCDPYENSRTNVVAVSSYNEDEIDNYLKSIGIEEYSLVDSIAKHKLINFLYSDYKEMMFSRLKNRMDFCSVIFDMKTSTLIAGVTSCIDNKLYYGCTPSLNEIMFSNNSDFLKQFVKEVFIMEANTYMKNGEFYSLDGTKIHKNIETKEIKKDTVVTPNEPNANNFLDGLNLLLTQIADKVVRERIEININEYLNSEEINLKINNKMLDELNSEAKKLLTRLTEENNKILIQLNNETKKTILEIIKQTIEEYKKENFIEEQIEKIFDDKLKELIEKTPVPTVNIIKLNDIILGQTEASFYHEKYEQILTQTQLDEPIMLIGPAGSGKNVAIKQVSNALGLNMYYTNNASNEFKLTGFIDAGGNYRDTEFYKAFKNGGVFFLDEIDNSDPSALIVINSALANGYMAFPHETIEKHPNFRIIAAANTWGKGADLQYVGRNSLDGATLDRFDNIFFDYDKELEQALYPNEEVLQFMWSFRNAVYQCKIPHIVSTRGIGKVYKKEINGISVKDTLTSNVIKNLNQDDVNSIIGNMQDIDSNNKYYDGIKQLRLCR